MCVPKDMEVLLAERKWVLNEKTTSPPKMMEPICDSWM